MFTYHDIHNDFHGWNDDFDVYYIYFNSSIYTSLYQRVVTDVEVYILFFLLCFA